MALSCREPLPMKCLNSRSFQTSSAGGQLQRQLSDFSQIQFSRSEVRNCVDPEEGLTSRRPEIGQTCLLQTRQTTLQLLLIQSVQHQQPFSLLFVGSSSDDKYLFVSIRQLV